MKPQIVVYRYSSYQFSLRQYGSAENSMLRVYAMDTCDISDMHLLIQ